MRTYPQSKNTSRLKRPGTGNETRGMEEIGADTPVASLHT